MVFFSHKHVISGATIVHSHIHTDSHHDTTNGNHTEQSITLIAQYSHIEYIDFTHHSIPIPYQSLLHKQTFIHAVQWVASVYLQNHALRAPPANT
jgi:hypothetical protein